MTACVCDLRRRLGTVSTVRFFTPSENLTMDYMKLAQEDFPERDHWSHETMGHLDGNS